MEMLPAMSVRRKCSGTPSAPGPAQRRQPVADLLEARIEAVADAHDVAAQLVGRRVERRVGHEHRAGEIAGERLGEAARRHPAEASAGAVDELVEQRRRMSSTPIRRARRKRTLTRAEIVGEQEASRRRGARRPACTSAAGTTLDGDADGRGCRWSRSASSVDCSPDSVGQRFLGRRLQARKVVGAVGDEVLDLLARRRARPAGAAAAHEIEHVAGARRQLLALRHQRGDEAAAAPRR